MTLRAKVRGQVRIVSKAMARRLRAKGYTVEDSTRPAAPPPPPADDTGKPVEQPNDNLGELMRVAPNETVHVETDKMLAAVELESFSSASQMLVAEADPSKSAPPQDSARPAPTNQPNRGGRGNRNGR